MINEKEIMKALEPLPFPIKSTIYSQVQRRYLEAKAAEVKEEDIKREIVLTILQELFTNFVEPLEMIDSILESKPLLNINRFRIEFSEISFDRQFSERGKEFVNSFWLLAQELGLEKEVRPKKQPQKYENKYED